MYTNWQNRLSLAVPARRLTILAGLLLAVNSVAFAQAPTTSGTTKPAKAQKSAPKKTKANTKKDSKTPVGKPTVVLVFPLDAKGTGEQLSDIVTDVIKSRLELSGKYTGISYLTSLPSIRKAVNEQTLSQTDVQPPFTSRTKVQKLAATAGYNFAIVSSLDQYDYNADTQNVSIVLSITLTDFSSGTPKNFTAAEPVTTAAKSAKNATDTVAAEAAVRALTEKLIASVLNSAK